MEKNGHFEVWLVTIQIADHKTTKQATVHHLADMHVMVVERPCADSVFFHVKHVTPFFAWADSIAPIAIVAMDTERPRAIRIDTVMQSMQMKTMRLRVCIVDMDIKLFTWLSVDDRTRNSAFGRGFIYVFRYQRIGFQEGVIGIKILPVHQCFEPPPVYF